jgi:hypothetical protein
MNKEVKVLAACLLLSALLGPLLGGCASETLFRSKFDTTPVGATPTIAAIGSVATEGNVTVINAPVLPSGRWVQMARPVADTAPAVFHARLSAVHGDGRYTFAATVFMPTGSQVSTIEFASAGAGSFMHLDLMPDNKVRIDDVAGSEFGGFPRDKPFIVQVTFDVDATPTAHIVLAGDGVAPNSVADHSITLAPRIAAARQFSTVLLSKSFPHLGVLQATNISVTRRKD